MGQFCQNYQVKKILMWMVPLIPQFLEIMAEDYISYCKEILKLVDNKPVSLEVIADMKEKC